MRLRSPFLMVLALVISTSACSSEKIFAPDASASLVLPPFVSQTMGIYALQSPGQNYIVMNTPVGVDPVVDYTIENTTANNPGIKVELFRTPDQSAPCFGNDCAKTVWRIETLVSSISVGEARVTVWLRNKPTEKSSFRVISYDPWSKG